MRPLVTIAVPAYNHVEYLHACLSSVVAQTASDWEAVVVDDGSTRGDCAAVVEGIGDTRVRLVRHDRNRGLSAARNTAIREGNGQYIVPLDSDDCLAPTYLAEVLGAMEPECDAVFTDLIAFGARSGHLPYQVHDVKALLKEQWIPGAGTLFRRSVWEHAGGYCEADALRAGNEDWDFWLSVAERGLRVRHVPRPLYLYRQHQESMVSRLQLQDSLTREFIYQRHSQLFDRNGMKNTFLSGGYFESAKAHWRRQERGRAVQLGLHSFLLSPVSCARSFAQQALRLIRPHRLAQSAVGTL